MIMEEDKSAFTADYEKKDYYILGSDYHGTVRLALQDYIWREALNFNIHPSIPKLSKDARVADVATGTGLWLMDVGRELGPSAVLDGFDINLQQAPPKPWLPANLNMHTWNLFEEPPQEFHGKYDLVHVRLITVVIKNNDPAKIVKNLCKLLKPGGWLQWDEVDVFASFVVKAFPDMQVPHMEQWCAWMGGPKRENQISAASVWTNGAVELLNENGFTNTKRHDHANDFTEHIELMRYNNDQLLMLSEQYARRVFADGNEMGPKLLEILAGAAKDAEKGSVMIMPPIIFTARKAT